MRNNNKPVKKMEKQKFSTYANLTTKSENIQPKNKKIMLKIDFLNKI